MRSVRSRASIREHGFTLIEIMIALLITTIVMGAVFTLLKKGQDTFGREAEVADVNQSARVGLDMMNRDLMMAGYRTPPAMAILWSDGGGITPDELTIVYSDDTVPQSKPMACPTGGGGGACKTIDMSSTVRLELDSFDPPLPEPIDPDDALAAFSDPPVVMFAIETGGECKSDGLGITPFKLTQPPRISNAGGSPALQLNHNPGGGDSDSELNPPGGFNGAVDPDCTVFGFFRVVQYRINPLPPVPNPMLERRDMSRDEPWTPVANNIENLQVEYAIGSSPNFVDVPGTPDPEDPNTWITRVRVTLGGRSQSKNLQGASAGVFDAKDTHLRKTFSTVVSLRNQVSSPPEAENAGYN